MRWHDKGIVINTVPYSENGIIVTILSQDNGLTRGFVNGRFKNMSVYQVGNILSFTWSGRLAEHLGKYINVEVIRFLSTRIMLNRYNSVILSVVCTILYNSLIDCDKDAGLFDMTHELLSYVAYSDDYNQCLGRYIAWEIYFLKCMGFALVLDKCAVSGSDINLYYVSPKTGRAVSKACGKQYHDKLLLLPQFLYKSVDINKADLINGFNLTTYFLQKHIYLNKALPCLRRNLIDHLYRS